MSARDQLARPRLDDLGFREADATAFLAGLDLLDEEDWGLVERLYDRVAATIGRVDSRDNPVEGEPDDHPAGPDFPLLAALVALAPRVQQELVRRGLDEESAWRSVSDLGQQVHVHRLVHGRFGFGGRPWVPVNFSGSLVWLGRLQYTIERDDTFGWVLGVHIPESGPLTPEDVDESLSLARDVALPLYREHPVDRFICVSWLLDRGLAARLNPASNLARFAARFTPYGEPFPGYRDALYFGFHRETRGGQQVDLATLPRDNSLHRAILDQLADGGVVCQPGWMPLA